jgi:hypothetical protein
MPEARFPHWVQVSGWHFNLEKKAEPSQWPAFLTAIPKPYKNSHDHKIQIICINSDNTGGNEYYPHRVFPWFEYSQSA